MGNTTEIVKALMSPIEKLITAVQSAIGKIYEPHYTKKMAEAEAKGIKLISQAIRENGDMEIIYKSEKLVIRDRYVRGYLQNIQHVNMAQAIKRQMAKEDIADTAYDILSETPDIKVPSDFDRDWMSKFFDYAQEISDDDLKLLWARILAGEIKQPGSFSRRTLNILYNLSKSEALIFNKICQGAFKIGGTYQIPIFYGPEYGFKIEASDMLTMEECGLVHSLTNLMMSAPNSQEEILFTSSGDIAIFTQNKPITMRKGEKLSLTGFQFTSSGNELISIIGEEISSENLLKFAAELKKTSSDKLIVRAYKRITTIDGATTWDKSVDLLK